MANAVYNFYQYNSDNGTSYSIKLSGDVAGIGGFLQLPNPDALPAYPFHAHDMRHIWFKSQTNGNRIRIPVSSGGSSFFMQPTQITYKSDTYQPEGAIGEKRAVSHRK